MLLEHVAVVSIISVVLTQLAFRASRICWVEFTQVAIRISRASFNFWWFFLFLNEWLIIFKVFTESLFVFHHIAEISDLLIKHLRCIKKTVILLNIVVLLAFNDYIRSLYFLSRFSYWVHWIVWLKTYTKRVLLGFCLIEYIKSLNVLREIWRV